MSLFSARPTVADLLKAEGPRLDRIFGEGGYRVEARGDQAATILAAGMNIDVVIEHDNRLACLIAVADPPEGTEGDGWSSLWGRFLGLPDITPDRDRSGRVTLWVGDQLMAELTQLERLVGQVFAHPQRRRDACWFVQGYTQSCRDRVTAPDLP